jgi:hypothetical protein
MRGRAARPSTKATVIARRTRIAGVTASIVLLTARRITRQKSDASDFLDADHKLFKYRDLRVFLQLFRVFIFIRGNFGGAFSY